MFGSLASKKEGSVAQSVRHLERLVESGKISPSEFHMRKAQLLEQSSTGVDDLSTCSTGEVFTGFLSQSMQHYCGIQTFIRMSLC